MQKLVFFLILSIELSAQNNVSLFDSYMKAQSSQYDFNGNVLVSKNGHIIYQNSFGWANYTTKTKLDKNSVFDCGSIAKEFTAMGLSLIHISEPTRLLSISYAVFCLKKKKY